MPRSRASWWRGARSCTRRSLSGQDPERYGGAGYGNVSGRVGAASTGRGRRGFLITGTQTGGLRDLALSAFCLVTRYDYRANTVISEGEILPSSESMTHGSIYDLTPQIRFVLHAHSPVIWRNAEMLRLPTTAPEVPYGTPAMADEVQRLYRSSALAERQVFAMGGHEDGIIAFGHSLRETGQALLAELANAYEQCCRCG